MKNFGGFTAFALFFSLLVGALLGYWFNIYNIIQAVTGEADIGVLLIAQLIGTVVAPLGILLGWLV